MDGVINRLGRVKWPEAAEQVHKYLDPTKQKGVMQRWGLGIPEGLQNAPPNPPDEKTIKKIKSIKNPTPEQADDAMQAAGFGHGVSTAEAQRLKLNIEVALKKLEYDKMRNQLIDADVVKRESFSAGLQIREGLESIADRCAPLVAATSDQFECREILAKEINHILTGLADLLEVKV